MEITYFVAFLSNESVMFFIILNIEYQYYCDLNVLDKALQKNYVDQFIKLCPLLAD